MITIDATLRDVKVNPKHIRAEGNMPAVFYGKGVETTAITTPLIAFTKAYREAGESTIVTLKVGDKKYSVLIHALDVHPVTGVPMHADFLVVPMDKVLEVSVPLVFVGEMPAAKLGATLLKVLHEVNIAALPADLPHDIKVDVSSLAEVHAHITIGDLKLPKGVKVLDDAAEIVASAVEAMEEEVAPVAAVDMAAVEVEKKGKKEEAAPAA
jgi:large subunit ribosomal protein L25